MKLNVCTLTNKRPSKLTTGYIVERKLIELLTGWEEAVGSLSSTLLHVVDNAKVPIIGGSP